MFFKNADSLANVCPLSVGSNCCTNGPAFRCMAVHTIRAQLLHDFSSWDKPVQLLRIKYMTCWHVKCAACVCQDGYVCVVMQFVNKDIVPTDGPAIVKAAYKMWKQTGRKQKPQATGEAWQRLSKAEAANVKAAQPVAMHAQAAPCN